MALTDKLSAIGTAIREKTGGSELLTLDAMPEAIRGISGGGGGEVEPLELSGDCSYGCYGKVAGRYIELFGNTISTKDITSANNMFSGYSYETIPFSLNFASYNSPMSNMFRDANLTSVPVMTGVYPSIMNSLFSSCKFLRELPEDFGADWNWSTINTSTSSASSIFSDCYSLRRVPQSFLSNLWGLQTSSTSVPYYNMFYNCYTLDEIINIPVQPSTMKSNGLGYTAANCARLKNFTFETNEDGTPIIANWKTQTLDFSYRVGFDNSYSNMTTYNSGITRDKEVKDDATYQALKDDPDWFSCNINYSRYNHDSAVATINSLPDTSEYLAANGGTNTIKLKGASGTLTDGGAISNLTEEEIAVAAAKGWTISLS